MSRGLIVCLLFLAGMQMNCAAPQQRPAPIAPPSPEVSGVSSPPVKVLPTTLPTTVASTVPTTAPAPAIIGRSVNDLPIEMVKIGDGDSPLLILAGVHGDEAAGCYLAEQLIQVLRSKDGSSAAVCIIACVNPDGRAARTRTNVHGVDINRNFPASNWRLARAGATYSGPSAASEPETKALIQTINQIHPRLIISIHCIRDGLECNNYDGPATRPAEVMSRYNHYPVRESIGYPTPGSLGAWVGIDRKIPIVTLELPADQSAQRCWAANREALLAVIDQSSSGFTSMLLK